MILRQQKTVIKTAPFPHIHINNIFTDEFYRELNDNFPDESWFADRENGDNRTTSHTNRFNLSAGQYGDTNFNTFINLEKNSCWRKLYELVSSKDFTHKIINYFNQFLRPNGYIPAGYAKPTFDISYQTDGYSNPPHLDSVYHIAQMMIYLDPSGIEEGGDITTWHYNNNKLDVYESYKTTGNSALLWLNTDKSYHAAHPTLKGKRKTIYIAFDSVLSSAWNNRPGPSYFEYNKKNARSAWRIYDPATNSYG